ncbi:MAG: lipid-transfer protein [bacterium]|nr:lipid-transfer protein [Deltaproteobacteria bacterium]MCP4907991.1 lipid-transfer protein [bacterium]
MIRDKSAIVGIGHTEYVRRIGRSERETAHEASLTALADAGLTSRDVDGIFHVEGQSGQAADLARRLGAPNLRAWAAAGGGGGAACAPVVHAAMAIATGMCEVAIAYRARNRGAVGARPWAKTSHLVSGQAAFESPHGFINPVHQQAFMARRYLYESGAPQETFAHISVAQRRYASRNPVAYFRDLITIDDVLGSRMIADPLHLLECCPENDGACAVVVTTAERARDCPQIPAWISGVAQGVGPRHVPMTNFYNKANPWDWPGAYAARDVYAMAGLGPADIDVFQLYDMFAPVVAYGLEAYGFCKTLEGGHFVVDGNTATVSATIPTNTAGGSLSEAYIHGFNHILEGVRQLRGTSGNQVPGAEVSLVAAAPVVPTSAILLTRK